MALRAEFARAVAEGWIAYFQAASARYEVRAEVLMGIASRETAMGGPLLRDGSFKWLAMPGDGGHGYGLMQIDKASYPAWVATEAWQRAEPSIHMGAAVLRAKTDSLVVRRGLVVRVQDRKSRQVYPFLMPALEGAVLERVAIASYNAGDWAPYHYVKGRGPDYGTTGRDYSADVLGRAVLFSQWLEATHAENHDHEVGAGPHESR